MEQLSPHVELEPEDVGRRRLLTMTADTEASQESPVVSVRSELLKLLNLATAILIWLGLLVFSALERGPAVEAEPPYVVAVFAVVYAVGMIVKSRRAVPQLSQLPIRRNADDVVAHDQSSAGDHVGNHLADPRLGVLRRRHR